MPAPAWDEITKSAEYASLTPEAKRQLADHYYDNEAVPVLKERGANAGQMDLVKTKIYADGGIEKGFGEKAYEAIKLIPGQLAAGAVELPSQVGAAVTSTAALVPGVAGGLVQKLGEYVDSPELQAIGADAQERAASVIQAAAQVDPYFQQKERELGLAPSADTATLEKDGLGATLADPRTYPQAAKSASQMLASLLATRGMPAEQLAGTLPVAPSTGATLIPQLTRNQASGGILAAAEYSGQLGQNQQNLIEAGLDPTQASLAAATASTVAAGPSAMLESTGLGIASEGLSATGTALAKQLILNAPRVAAAEGLTEAAQSVVQSTANTAVGMAYPETDANVLGQQYKQALTQQAPLEGVIGAVAGVSINAGVNSPNLIDWNKMAEQRAKPKPVVGVGENAGKKQEPSDPFDPAEFAQMNFVQDQPVQFRTKASPDVQLEGVIRQKQDGDVVVVTPDGTERSVTQLYGIQNFASEEDKAKAAEHWDLFSGTLAAVAGANPNFRGGQVLEDFIAATEELYRARIVELSRKLGMSPETWLAQHKLTFTSDGSAVIEAMPTGQKEKHKVNTTESLKPAAPAASRAISTPEGFQKLEIAVALAHMAPNRTLDLSVVSPALTGQLGFYKDKNSETLTQVTTDITGLTVQANLAKLAADPQVAAEQILSAIVDANPDAIQSPKAVLQQATIALAPEPEEPVSEELAAAFATGKMPEPQVSEPQDLPDEQKAEANAIPDKIFALKQRLAPMQQEYARLIDILSPYYGEPEVLDPTARAEILDKLDTLRQEMKLLEAEIAALQAEAEAKQAAALEYLNAQIAKLAGKRATRVAAHKNAVQRTQELIAEMWKESAYLRRWFGKSQITEEVNGEVVPKFVAHGTTAKVDFDVFRMMGQDFGIHIGPPYSAFAFTTASPSKDNAPVYNRGRIYALMVRIENPLRMVDTFGHWYGNIRNTSRQLYDLGLLSFDQRASLDYRARQGETIFERIKERAEKAYESVQAGTYPEEDYIDNFGALPEIEPGMTLETAIDKMTLVLNTKMLPELRMPKLWQELVDAVKAAGYDGVIYNNRIEPGIEGPEDSYIVFDPNQVKSVYANNGYFSLEEDSIKLQTATQEATAGKIADTAEQPSGELGAAKRGTGEVLGFFKGITSREAVIGLLENADATTVVHEMMHYFLATANRSELRLLRRAFNFIVGDLNKPLTTAQEERVVSAFENWLRGNTSANVRTQGWAQRFATWVKDIYLQAKTVPNYKGKEVNVSPEMDAFFTTLFMRTQDYRIEQFHIKALEANVKTAEEITNAQNNAADETKLAQATITTQTQTSQQQGLSGEVQSILPRDISKWAVSLISPELAFARTHNLAPVAETGDATQLEQRTQAASAAAIEGQLMIAAYTDRDNLTLEAALFETLGVATRAKLGYVFGRQLSDKLGRTLRLALNAMRDGDAAALLDLEASYPGMTNFATRIRTFLDEWRTKYQDHMKRLLLASASQNGKRVERAFHAIVYKGVDFDIATNGMTESKIAVVQELVDAYEAAGKWGKDDYIPQYERGGYALVTLEQDANGEVQRKLIATIETPAQAADKIRDLKAAGKISSSTKLYLDKNSLYNADMGPSGRTVTRRAFHALKATLEKQFNGDLDKVNAALKAINVRVERGTIGIPPLRENKEIAIGEADLWEQLQHYTFTMNKKMVTDVVLPEITRTIEANVAAGRFEAAHLLALQKRGLTGEWGAERTAENFMKRVDRNIVIRGLTGAWRLFARGLLFGRIGSGLVQAALDLNRTQAALGGPAKLVRHWIAARQFLATPEGKEYFQQEVPFMAVDKAFLRALIKRYGRGVSPGKAYTQYAMNLFNWFGGASSYLRTQALVINYMYAKSLGLSETAARQDARRALRFQQFAMTSVARPQALRSMTANEAFRFKAYILREAEFFAHANGAQRARYLSGLLVIGGPRVFVAFLESALTVFGLGLAAERMEEFYRAFVDRLRLSAGDLVGRTLGYGLTGAANIDIGNSALPQFPSTAKEFFGPGISQTLKLLETGQRFLIEKHNKPELLNSIPTSLIPAFADWQKVFNAQFSDGDGMVRDAKGRPLYEVGTAHDLLFRGLMHVKTIDQGSIQNLNRLAQLEAQALNTNGRNLIEKIRKQLDAGEGISEEDLNYITENAMLIDTSLEDAMLKRLLPYDVQLMESMPMNRRAMLIEKLRQRQIEGSTF